MSNKKLKTRLIIVKIIKETLLSKHSLKSIYSRYLNNVNLSSVDIRFVTEITQGTLRMLKRIDYEISEYYEGKIKKLEKKFFLDHGKIPKERTYPPERTFQKKTNYRSIRRKKLRGKQGSNRR